MSRRFRLLTVLLMLWAQLWSTGALAGYACAGSGKAFEVAQMFEAGLPCAQEMSQAMDEEEPQLCHAHCQSDHQSADTASPAVFATLEQLGPVLTLAPVLPPAPPGTGLMVSQLRRDTAPPLALRHCCLRT